MTRLKPYISPDTRPICQPPELVDEPYLTEDDFPADSFLVEQQEGNSESQDSDHASLPEATQDVSRVETRRPTPTSSSKDTLQPQTPANATTQTQEVEAQPVRNLNREIRAEEATPTSHKLADSDGDIYQVRSCSNKEWRTESISFLLNGLDFLIVKTAGSLPPTFWTRASSNNSTISILVLHAMKIQIFCLE